MAMGPYGVVDWPAGCDPEWSDLNGGCSDSAGDFINPKTGGSVSSDELVSIIRGVANIVRKPAAQPAVTPNAPATPAPTSATPFDPVTWIKSGYNVLYVAAAVVALLAVLSSLSGGGRRR